MAVEADPSRPPKTLFLAALAIRDAAQRRALLDQACAGDARRREWLEQMLAAAENPALASPLDQAVEQLGAAGEVDIEATAAAMAAGTAPAPDEPNSPRRHAAPRIDGYTLRERIAEGGMGTVYVAEQIRPLRRKVALKLIKPGLGNEAIVNRFEAERQALAMMDHPNIARIFDGGTTATGQPFFAMELVQGLAITEYCDRQRLPLRERLQLFHSVCRAVEHAHQRGIIHRDLKPSNVLVAEIDGAAVPKVIDFGVAKAVDQKLTEQTVYTLFAEMIGTPQYMSPEQAQLGVVDVDTRSDVYSLGVLLYELLTGDTPLSRQRIRGANYDELRRLIREEEPLRPSDRISTLRDKAATTVAEFRRSEPRRLRDRLRSELDWLVMKALEKDRSRRYQSVADLAADVERFLSGQPIEACPPSLGYQLQKYAKRNRAVLTVLAIVLLTAATGSAVSLLYAQRANKSAVKARIAEARATRLAGESQASAERASDAAREADVAAQRAGHAAQQEREARNRERSQRQRAEQALYLSDIRLAAAQLSTGAHAEAVDSLLRQYPRGGAKEGAWEWYYLLGQSVRWKQGWKGHYAEINAIDWSSDGTQIATVGNDARARVWDAQSGAMLKDWRFSNLIKTSVAWSPTARWLAWGSASNEGVVRIWDRTSSEITELDTGMSSIWTLAWRSDARQLIAGAISGEADSLIVYERQQSNWEVRNRLRLPKHVVHAGWSEDGNLIAVFLQSGGIRFYEASQMELVEELNDTSLLQGSWTRHGNRIAYGCWSGECVIIDVDRYEEVHRLDAHFDRCGCARWSPDGRWLATAGADGAVHVWSTDDWTRAYSFQGHRGAVDDVAWHPRLQQLVSVCADGMVYAWSLDPTPAHRDLPPLDGANMGKFTWSADGRLLFPVDDAAISAVDVDTGVNSQFAALPEPGPWWLVNDKLACRLATGDVIRLSDGQRWHIEGLPTKRVYQNIGAAPHGDALAFCFGFDRPAFIAREDGPLLPVGSDIFEELGHICWSHDGQRIALAGASVASNGRSERWSGWLYLAEPTGRIVARTRVGTRPNAVTQSVAWDPDDQRIAAATGDGMCEIFRVADLHKIAGGPIHDGNVISLSWHPNSNRIASGGVDHRVNIIDAQSSEPCLTLAMDASVARVEWSPEGRVLAAQGRAGQLRLWDARAGYELAQSQAVMLRLDAIDRGRLAQAVEGGDMLAANSDVQARIAGRRIADAVFGFEAALLAASKRDTAGYRRTCRAIQTQRDSTIDARQNGFAAWACALAPEALDDYSAALLQVRAELAADPNSSPAMVTLGALQYRSGDVKDAVATLQQALTGSSTSTAYGHYFLAMAKHALGDEVSAEHHRQLADDLMQQALAAEPSPAWTTRLTLQLLHDEATALSARL